LNAIAQMRRNIGGEVFDYQVLVDALAGYRKPRDRITKLLASGAIVRVKKGLYCFGEAFRKEPLSREYLANLIYGPSYVSLEYALSHHGLIPERVETVTSVTTRRSRDFDTPFGAFSYRMLNGPRYAVGAILEISWWPPQKRRWRTRFGLTSGSADSVYPIMMHICPTIFASTGKPSAHLTTPDCRSSPRHMIRPRSTTWFGT